jgi:hypothetical protein
MILGAICSKGKRSCTHRLLQVEQQCLQLGRLPLPQLPLLQRQQRPLLATRCHQLARHLLLVVAGALDLPSSGGGGGAGRLR